MGPSARRSPLDDGEQAVQERVLRVPGLETGRGAEVVGRRVDGLAARERRDHLRRPVTKPERRHVDERAVVGLEREAQVELEDAVAPEQRPVTAPGQHLAAQPRALEVPARDRCGDARAVRHGADLLHAADRDLQRHEKDSIHWSIPCLSLGSPPVAGLPPLCLGRTLGEYYPPFTAALAAVPALGLLDDQPVRDVVLEDVGDVGHRLAADALGRDLLDVAEPDVRVRVRASRPPSATGEPGPAPRCTTRR